LQDFTVKLVPEKSVFNAAMVREKLGLRLEKASEGFTISEVQSGSPASDAGLQRGMVIQAIDGQTPPVDVAGVAKLLYAKKKGEPVRFDLRVTERVGNFNVLRSGRVELMPR
jgi:predicted metalloprotease with PDZ domain